MKIAVTGHTGRVGKLLVSDYGAYPLIADITKETHVENALDTIKPHVVIHLAGYSDVDFCQDPANFNRVMDVNFNGALNVFRQCQDRNIRVVYVSTEQIFSGKTFLGFGGGPYNEIDAPAFRAPNIYALSKLGAESLRHSFPVVKVVRSSHLFTYDRLYKELTEYKSFPTFIRRSYIYLPHFVRNLHMFASLHDAMPVVLNLAGSKVISQYELMKEFVRRFRFNDIRITRRTKEISGMAPRPHKSGLTVSFSAFIGFPQYSYLDGMIQMEKDNVRG